MSVNYKDMNTYYVLQFSNSRDHSIFIDTGNDHINLYNPIRKIFYGNLSMAMAILSILFCLSIAINKHNLGLVMHLYKVK